MPYQESINAIKKEININQGKTTKKEIKKISFDINKPYESEIVGKGNYSKISLSTLKDLSSYSVPSIKSYANEVNKTLHFIDVETNQEIQLNDFSEYLFFYQKEHKDIMLNQIKEINIFVKKRTNTNVNIPSDDTTDDNTNNDDTTNDENTDTENNTQPENPPIVEPPVEDNTSTTSE